MEDVHRAIHETVLEAGPKTLAHLMGMSHTNLLNRVNPNDDTHRLNVEQYLQVLVHSQDIRSLKAIAHELGYDLVPREQPKATTLNTALLRLHADLADVTRLAFDAQADGYVCAREKAELLREADEVVASMEVFRESVRAA